MQEAGANASPSLLPKLLKQDPTPVFSNEPGRPIRKWHEVTFLTCISTFPSFSAIVTKEGFDITCCMACTHKEGHKIWPLFRTCDMP